MISDQELKERFPITSFFITFSDMKNKSKNRYEYEKSNRLDQYELWKDKMHINILNFIIEEKIEKIDSKDFIILYQMYNEELTNYEIRDCIDIYEEIKKSKNRKFWDVHYENI